MGARLGDGWFVHVGATPAEAVAVHAARYAEAIAFDVSAGSSAASSTGSDGAAAPAGLLTIRERDAAKALRRWNATVPR